VNVKTPEMKPPDWSDPMTLKSYSWCINHDVKIGAFATTQGYKCRTWVIEVTVNGKSITSPKEYGPEELYPKIFELYRFYYDKYNKDEKDKLNK